MIIICVPVPKDFSIDVRTAAYCSAEAMRPGVKWGYASSRDCGVGKSTSIFYALKDPDVTHIYTMDYDVVPPDGALQRLLDHDLPIVAGIYPMMTHEKVWSFKLNHGWQSKNELLPKGLTKVKAIGGSTVLVKREVLEKMGRPWWMTVYKPIDDEGRCYDLHEDEFFSKRATEAGYDLIIDPTVICRHYNYGEI